MIVIEITFLVERPIEDVFKLISDIPSYRRWVMDNSGFFLENKIVTEGPIGLGTSYVDKLRWGGRAFGQIINYKPFSKIGFQQRMAFGLTIFDATIEYELKVTENHTEVKHRVVARPQGFFRLFQPILSRIIRSEIERTCKAIKQTLKHGLRDAV